MWATLAKYLGVELGKALLGFAKDWLAEYKLKKEQGKKDALLKKRETLFLALEVARVNGDFSAVDRISSELGRLSID